MQQKGRIYSVEVKEIQAFFALLLLLDIILFPLCTTIEVKIPVLAYHVANVMAQDRFLEIRRALPFVNNDQTHDEQDNAWNVRSIINQSL